MGGLVLWFCWFVCLFNLIICKVMFLFLFTLLSSYLTSVWKSSLVTVHFFFCLLIMTTINYQFCVGGCVWCQLFPADVTDQQTRRDTSTPTHTQGWPQGATPTGSLYSHSLETQWPVTSAHTGTPSHTYVWVPLVACFSFSCMLTADKWS